MKKIFKTLLIMTVVVSAPAMAQNEANPLLQEWNTPYGTPPFSKIENRHYAPAVRQAIEMAEANVKAIKKSKEPPTFANTIEALERSSETLDRITGVLFNLDECNTNDELSAIVMQLTPELTRHENSVWMDEGLFERVKAVYDNRGGLTAEERMLTEKTYKAFVRNGVNLDRKAKKEYEQTSEELARLGVQFNKNVLADNNAFALNVTDKALLAGIPDGVLASAKEEAQKRGLQGWTLTLDYPIYGPVMQHADSRSLREQMWRAYNSRGNHGDANDNNEVIRRTVALRHRLAQLLGHKDYLDYKLDRTMAHDAATLNDFMLQLIGAAYSAAKRDLDSVAKWADDNQIFYPLQRWDFSYLAEKLKQERYDFDAEALRPYFQLEQVRKGIFDLYGKLYGISFKEVDNIDKYHPDAKTFEVWDGERFMGVLYMDMFPRASKRGGAWMTEFRGQNKYDGRETRPLVQVVTNFSKPTADAPSLLSFDEVETFMHEMGHAMHAMLSDVTHESLSGTNVYRDFVEMPSQVMENWCREPEWLNTFARHYKTGAAIPEEYIKKIIASDRYLAGWLCIRQLSLGLVDLSYHTLVEPLQGPVENFERQHMIELLPPIEGCNTSTSFTHIFAGGYAAGYYSYKWSEMLDADVFDQFRKAGIMDRANAMRFRNEVLSKGGSEDPAALFRNYMGRNPSPKALLLREGFIDDAQATKTMNP